MYNSLLMFSHPFREGSITHSRWKEKQSRVLSKEAKYPSKWLPEEVNGQIND